MPQAVVKKAFRCKESKQVFKEGDVYAHDSVGRLSFLMLEGFLEQKDLKEEPEADKVETASAEPVHLGGGYYKLPDGSKVKGKKNAIKAMDK